MAQKVTGIIKLQINAAKATASPPVGPALGQHGVTEDWEDDPTPEYQQLAYLCMVNITGPSEDR